MKRTSAPKYMDLAEQLRRQIQTQVLRPGDQLPTFAAMQTLHGATPTTVERVYRILEQEKLIMRHPRRGVFVAERQVPVRTGTLGVMDDVTRTFLNEEIPYYTRLNKGILTGAHRSGWEVLWLNAKSPGWEKVDGVLKYEDWQCSVPMLIPWVSLLHPVQNVPSIVANEYAGMKMATEHLLQLGHRRIHCLLTVGDEFSQTRGVIVNELSQKRVAGYQAAMWEAGIEPKPSSIHGLRVYGEPARPFEELGYDRVREWLNDGWNRDRCTALLTQNDGTAIGALRALREAGIRVPEDLSMVGFDGTEMGEWITPRLTSVEMPLRRIGELGVETLIRQIEGERVDDETVVLPMRLIKRDSTGPVPTGPG